jgi:putative transposase
VKYAFIQDRISDVGNRYRLGAFCRMLEVSRSGYYDWIERSTQPDPDAVALELAARVAHTRGRESYAPKRLRTELSEMGFPRSLAPVKRLRARLGLRCRHKRRFVRTTDGNHTLPIAPNLLEQRFNETTAPNQVWVSDITYVHTDEGWLYVAAIKDLFNKKIVGWAMMDHMRTALVSQALWMAFKQERPTLGLIQHSDRGSQYASGEYRALLEQFGMKASMSRRGNCYENVVSVKANVSNANVKRSGRNYNAPMESFWASLKKEQVHHQHYATRAQAKADIFDYIECFYNTIRRHSALGNQSPLNFTASLASDSNRNAI